MGKARYKSQEVTVVRAAKQGDPEFNANLGDQVIVKLKDGKEQTVPKAEVTES